MALRNIRELGESIFNKRCKDVTEMTPRIKELIQDMLDTLYDAQGVGLAAPQVGIMKRIVVIDVDNGNPYIMINPKIIESSGEQVGKEACLSVPGKSGVVRRPDYVKVEALDVNMRPYELEGTELLARAICHELDHLDGILYIEKVEGELLDNRDDEEVEDE
jgi:peptide deformylase